MKKVLNIIVLPIICIVVAAALAFTNSMTLPVIIDRQAQDVQDSLAHMLPEGKVFTEIENETEIDEITSVFKTGNEAGFVLGVETPSYGGPIDVLVGVSMDGLVTGLRVINSKDTPGLGLKIMEDDFAAAFIGTTSVVTGADINVISGATISSLATVTAANIALDYVAEITGSAEPDDPDLPLKTALPGGEMFTEISVIAENHYGVYMENSGLGYVIRAVAPGYYEDNIVVLVGFDNEGTITGIYYEEIHETAGIGMKVVEDNFVSQFIGNTDGSSVDTIAEATISSKAVIKAVNFASDIFGAVKDAAAGITPVEKVDESHSVALPGGVSFTRVTVTANGVSGAWIEDSGMGYVIKSAAPGYYKDDIVVFTGFDSDGNITGIYFEEISETPGVGMKVVEDDFVSQFIGNADGSTVDIIAEATISSKAVVKAVGYAVAGLAEVKEAA